MDTLALGDAKKQILVKIFTYYGMSTNDPVLKGIWEDDLKRFGSEEIEGGFETYRRGPQGDKKPRSLDIEKCILARRKQYMPPDSGEYVQQPLKRGVSEQQARLIDGIEAMYRNNPKLDQDLSKTPRAAEKMLVCASALGNEGLFKSNWWATAVKLMGSNTNPQG